MTHIDPFVYITQIHRTDTSINALKPTKTYTHTHKHIDVHPPATHRYDTQYYIHISKTHTSLTTHTQHTT